MKEPFAKLKLLRNPGIRELVIFVTETEAFLTWVVSNERDFGFLWQADPGLSKAASEQLRTDVHRSAVALKKAIPNIDPKQLQYHGLIGKVAGFKDRVLKTISGLWGKAKKEFTCREWLMQMLEAVDVKLDSLIEAAGGVGGAFKEFKDIIAALIPRK